MNTGAPSPLHALFVWFGSKRKVADTIWSRLGPVQNYVEPFAGTASVLLARPDTHRWWDRFETINDADGLLVNAMRAVQHDSRGVAELTNLPVIEADLTARHLYLVRRRADLAESLQEDPDFYDLRAAAWWLWGVNAWVGGNWCTGAGPYRGRDEAGPGVSRKLPMVGGGHGGRGVHRPQPVTGQAPSLFGGVVPDVAGSHQQFLEDWFSAVANRLRRVRITCGDFTRLLGAATRHPTRATGVVLDPPYAARREPDLYLADRADRTPGRSIAAEAACWALEHGDDPKYRIAYCAYSDTDADAAFLAGGWTPLRWQAHGGYGLASSGRGRANRDREMVWFSPHCLPALDSAHSLELTTPTRH